MSYRVIHRPARATQPLDPARNAALEGPPVVDQDGGKVNFLMLVPLFGAAASMTIMMLFRGSPFAAIGAIMMIVAVLASGLLLFSQRGKARRDRQNKRDSYLEYLDEKRRQFNEEDSQLRQDARTTSPEFDLLANIVQDPQRLWERRRTDPDFLNLRLGTGERPVRSITISAEERAIERPDYFLTTEVEQVQQRYRFSPQLPCEFEFDSLGEMTVLGEAEITADIARQILCRAATFHSPEDLCLALVVNEKDREKWLWAAELPHTAVQDKPTKIGPQRRIYTSRAELDERLRPELIQRARAVAEARKNSRNITPRGLLSRMLIVDFTDQGAVKLLRSPDSTLSVEELGVTCVRFLRNRLEEPEDVSARIVVHDPDPEEKEFAEENRVQATYTNRRAENGRESYSFGVEPVTVAQAAGLARLIAPLRLSPDSMEHNDAVNTQRYTDMLDLHSFGTQAIEKNWQPRSEQDFLRIPLGPDDDGKPVLLDLKESAQLGMGPHGLCVGATGSGKSELLRTIVLALMTTHSPERLNMVLVDFKGGATFAPFEGVPHVNGIITNLQEDTSLIDRVHDSLAGEIRRRQEVLKEAGNIANVTDYELHRQEAAARGEEWKPLPHLLIIIDEFGELLTAQPDFIDLFLSIGRIGRSIGVHLMLSSQRIEAGKLRGLETYLSYRLGLRTLSESESRTVLETPDAFHLPAVPGYGYLKVDTTVYDRFKAGFVSGPYRAYEEGAEQGPEQAETLSAEPLLAPFSVEEQNALLKHLEKARKESRKSASLSESERTTGATVMSHLVSIMREFPRATNEIWLPPLPSFLSLDSITGQPVDTVDGFLAPTGGDLRIPVGTLDDPSRQWQGPWYLDLTRSGGNLAIIGGPHTGKTTALRTIALSAALTHHPEQLGIYGIDLKGSALLSLDTLPHVGGIGVRTVRENVRRTVEEIHGMLLNREEIFEKYSIDSLETLRSLHAQGRIQELPVADVMLLIDGYGQISEEFEEEEKLIHEILGRGGGYGIHVIATATRWNEVRIAQQAFFGNKIEFRLTEPGESAFGKKRGESLPVARPGRALEEEGLIGHFALPRMDSEASTESIAEAFALAAENLRENVDASMVPAVRVLPQMLPSEDVPEPTFEGLIPLGLAERTFRVQDVDLFGRDRHLIVMGDSQCGKTSLVRHAVTSLLKTSTPEDVVVALFDPRQELGELVPEDFLGGHAKSSLLAQKLAESIRSELEQRMPHDPLAPTPKGAMKPRIILVIDDYDVLTAGGSSPLSSLAPFVSMSNEIGLHVIMTRKVSGASRGLFEPFTSAVRESGAATFLMDGDRTEGALVNGIRAKHFPAGRGQFIRGGRSPETVQAAYEPQRETVREDESAGQNPETERREKDA